MTQFISQTKVSLRRILFDFGLFFLFSFLFGVYHSICLRPGGSADRLELAVAPLTSTATALAMIGISSLYERTVFEGPITVRAWSLNPTGDAPDDVKFDTPLKR